MMMRAQGCKLSAQPDKPAKPPRNNGDLQEDDTEFDDNSKPLDDNCCPKER